MQSLSTIFLNVLLYPLAVSKKRNDDRDVLYTLRDRTNGETDVPFLEQSSFRARVECHLSPEEVAQPFSGFCSVAVIFIP